MGGMNYPVLTPYFPRSYNTLGSLKKLSHFWLFKFILTLKTKKMETVIDQIRIKDEIVIKTLKIALKGLKMDKNLIRLGAPVSNIEFKVLKAMGEVGFTYARSGIHHFPQMVSPEVSILLLENYLNSIEIFPEGIRFYPAFDGSKLFFIICLGSLAQPNEQRYVGLVDEVYNTENPFLELEGNEAINLHNRYMNEICIFSHLQNDVSSPIYNSRKFSRYYSWDDISKLFKDNMTDDEINGTPKYSNFSLKFDFGYVSMEYSSVFQGRLSGYENKDLQGFTVLAHVRDEDGMPRMDATTVYNPEQPNNYRNLALEVGHPCPPRCGVLHQ